MGEHSERLRNRAKDCLNLAKGARHEADRIMLEEIAAELEAEAKRVFAEEADVGEARRPSSEGS